MFTGIQVPPRIYDLRSEILDGLVFTDEIQTTSLRASDRRFVTVLGIVHGRQVGPIDLLLRGHPFGSLDLFPCHCPLADRYTSRYRRRRRHQLDHFASVC